MSGMMSFTSPAGQTKRSSLIWTGLLLVILFLGASCRTTRKAIREPLKDFGADYLFTQLKRNELKFDWFTAKFSLDLSIEKKNTSFSGQIRMKKDSVIWVSFSPVLGIELARLLVTTDSVKFLNRMNSTYFTGDYRLVNEFLQTNVDYDVLQSILLGNDLTYYENGNFRTSLDNDAYHLVTAGRQKLKKFIRNEQDAERIYIQNIFIDPQTFKITQMKIKEIRKENKKLDAAYSDFCQLDGQLFPCRIDYDLSAETPVKAAVVYSRISIRDTLTFPFRIPRDYKPVQ
jgi:hypothetical protein